ncbi:MAG: C10 family peptidase [Prevotella sp.]|nr:C10 family peptidase [Prevotella sp.]
MRHYLLTLLLMMAAMTAMGQQTVSVADARAKATAFLNRNAGAKGGTVTTDIQLAYTAQQGAETYYYVFNNGSDGKGGFVIIGGDETARTILGYSDNGTFDYATAPENMKWWLSQYEQQISAAIKNGGTTAAAKGARAKGVNAIARADIEPLVKTKWDQVAPYNTAIPNNSGDYTSMEAIATGCVATAMAQIMKKHKHPTTGTGSHSYQSETLENTYSANFGSTTYLWDTMTYTYGNNTYSNTPAENAVATLMYHCGVAADMDYNTREKGGSSTSSFTAAQGMINYFKYDKGMSYEERAYYSDNDWAEMIYAELAAGRPVLYSGRTAQNAGHAFVCDGYKYEDGNDLFNINWGWGGSCNGYFPLQGTAGTVNALTPNGTGTGGGTAGSAYDLSQSVVIGIQPDNSSLAKIEMTCDGYSLGSNATAAGSSNSLTFTKVTNTSVIASSQTVGVRMVNDESSEATDIEATTWGLEPNYYYMSNKMSFTVPTQMDAGEYKIYPIFKDENDQWQIMKFLDGYNSIPTMTVLAAGEGLIADGTPTVSDDGYVTPTSGTYTIRVWNNSSVERNNLEFETWIYYLNGKNLIPMGYIPASATFKAHETIDVQFDFKNYSYQNVTNGLAMTAGNTYYAIPFFGGDQLRNYIDFQCTAAQTINYKLSSVGWGTLCLPFSAAIPDGLTMYEVTGTNGNELVKTSVDKIEINKAYLVRGTAGTYPFTGPTTTTGTYTNGLLTGNTHSTTVYVPKDSYVLQNPPSTGLAFYKVANNNSQNCSPYKAYLTLPSGSTSLYSALLFTDGTTGIESIEATDNQQGAVRKVLKNGRLTIETPQGSFTLAGARMK